MMRTVLSFGAIALVACSSSSSTPAPAPADAGSQTPTAEAGADASAADAGGGAADAGDVCGRLCARSLTCIQDCPAFCQGAFADATACGPPSREWLTCLADAPDTVCNGQSGDVEAASCKAKLDAVNAACP